jgi:hypothetical protein
MRVRYGTRSEPTAHTSPLVVACTPERLVYTGSLELE